MEVWTPFQAVLYRIGCYRGKPEILRKVLQVTLPSRDREPVFWMWISNSWKCVPKSFSEVTLAGTFPRNQCQRRSGWRTNEYYIKNGLEKHWHWLAYLFSAFGVLTVFGTGNATQVNTITTAIDSALINLQCGHCRQYSIVNLVMGIILAVLCRTYPAWRNQKDRPGYRKAGTVYGAVLHYSSCRRCSYHQLEKCSGCFRLYCQRCI